MEIKTKTKMHYFNFFILRYISRFFFGIWSLHPSQQFDLKNVFFLDFSKFIVFVGEMGLVNLQTNVSNISITNSIGLTQDYRISAKNNKDSLINIFYINCFYLGNMHMQTCYDRLYSRKFTYNSSFKNRLVNILHIFLHCNW